MIATDFDISDPLNWLLLSLLAMLLALQIWFLLKGDFATRRKRTVKLALNLFLWLVTLAFLLQPYGKVVSSPRSILVRGSHVPDAWVERLKDSLGIAQVKTQEGLDANEGDTIVLAGQDFGPTFYSRLLRGRQCTLRWIAYAQPDQLQDVGWEGMVRKGQIQQVHGTVQSSKDQFLKLRYAGNTLDSVFLEKGINEFLLKFPVFVQGNVLSELVLGEKTLDTLHFFARPAQFRAYHFVLDSPDFETRTLAHWLGKNGHSVTISSKLSKNVSGRQTINQTGEPDVYITDPANAADPIIRKALASGKSILLMGLNDVERDFVVVNNALGSNLRVTRAAAEETVKISEGLTAWPYQFVSSGRTFHIPDIPVAVIKVKGKIGVSLLNETFPLMLSGDSLGYSKIWTEILARVAPPDSANVEVKAPVFSAIASRIDFNNSSQKHNLLRMVDDRNEQDTLFPQTALLNEKTEYADFLPGRAGAWYALDGSFEGARFYVEKESGMRSVRQLRFLKALMASYQEAPAAQSALAGTTWQVPAWAWLMLFLLALSALWAEAKFS